VKRQVIKVTTLQHLTNTASRLRPHVAYIGPKSRTERPIGTKIGQRGSPRHTLLGHHFQGQKVKGQGLQAALLTAVLARQATAAVGVGTCWSWETSATLPSARRRFDADGGGEGRGHVAAAHLQVVIRACYMLEICHQHHPR